VEFSRHTIPVKNQKEAPQVLQTISGLKNLVVVNVASSIEPNPVLFSEENLRALLADAPEYKKLMRDKIDQVARALLSLRAALRTSYVADMAGQVRDFVRQLDQTLLMLKCYALQNAQSGVAENVQKLQVLIGQLAASSFMHGDNVRCMDDLQYEILPALKALLRVFGK